MTRIELVTPTAVAAALAAQAPVDNGAWVVGAISTVGASWWYSGALYEDTQGGPLTSVPAGPRFVLRCASAVVKEIPGVAGYPSSPSAQSIAPTYSAGKFGTAAEGAAINANNAGRPLIIASGPQQRVFDDVQNKLVAATVDCWFSIDAIPTGIKVMWGNPGWWAGVNNTGRFEGRYGGLAGLTTSSIPGQVTMANAAGPVVCDGLWHHLAWVFRADGKTTDIYLDGTRIIQNVTSVAYTWTGDTTTVGWGLNGWNNLGGFDWPAGAKIDEFRMSLGERYPAGATITVPTAPFTVDASTIALYHFDGDGTDATTKAKSYPVRPPLLPAGAVTYLGSTQPTDWMNDDKWEVR